MPDNLLEEIGEQVPRVLPEPVRILVSAAMQFERQRCLGVEPSAAPPKAIPARASIPSAKPPMAKPPMATSPTAMSPMATIPLATRGRPVLGSGPLATWSSDQPHSFYSERYAYDQYTPG